MSSKPLYKKRVIDESDDDEDTPLAAVAKPGAPQSAGMSKNGSNGSNHDPETIAEGAALLKQAGGDGSGKVSKAKRDVPGFARPSEALRTGSPAVWCSIAMDNVLTRSSAFVFTRFLEPSPLETQATDLHLEDAQVRHEATAAGFDSAMKAPINHAHQTNGASSNGHKMQVDKAGGSSDDEDAPLAKKANGNGTTALPSFKKTKGEKKEKPASKSKKASVKKEEEDVDMATASSAEDEPLAAKANGNGKAKKSAPSKKKKADSDSSEDDGVPLAQKAKAKKANGKKAQADSDDSDGEPLAKKSKSTSKGKKRSKKESDDGSDFEDEDVKPKKPAKKRAKKEDSEAPSNAAKALKKRVKKEDSATPSASGSTAKKGKAKEEDGSQADDDEDDQEKWWLNQQDDEGGPKWTTLQHSGVLFAPPYVPLPKDVKLKYNGW